MGLVEAMTIGTVFRGIIFSGLGKEIILRETLDSVPMPLDISSFIIK